MFSKLSYLFLFCFPTHAQQTAPPDIVVDEGIEFAVVDRYLLSLDIVYPKDSARARPCIVFIICGAFAGQCNRKLFLPRCREAAEKGYVSVAIEYRFPTRFTFPYQLVDIQRALSWIWNNAEGYNIDLKRVGLVGHYSGGTLSLMTVLADKLPEYEYRQSEEAKSIKAVVSIGSTVDFIAYGESAMHAAFLGGEMSDIEETYRTASPINYVTADSPPTLMGTEDQEVPIEQGEIFDKKMRETGAEHTFIKKTGFGNTVWQSETNSWIELWDPTIWEFLEEYLQ